MILGFLLQLLGLALLGAAMHAAPRVVKLRVGTRRPLLRGIGWTVLALSGASTLSHGPAGMLVLDWLGLLSVAAGTVLLCFTALARRTRYVRT